MRPCTGTRSQVSATWIPFDIGHSVMVRNTEQLDPAAPLLFGKLTLTAADVFRRIEIQVPEFKLRFT